MAKTKFDERLDRLKQFRSGSLDDAAIALIRKSLGDRSNLIVAEAAKAIGGQGLNALIPELLSAFARLFENPVKTDPKCWGKLAIIQALTQLDYSESPPFLRGAHHIQMEPVWGGQEDFAPQLRATCVLGLVQCADLGRNGILRELVDAVADPADPVRLEAVRAITQMNGDEGALLLRLKARLGDRRPVVTGNVFDAMLALEGVRIVPFVSGYLRSSDVEVRDEAVFALGSSRLADAIKALIDTWNESSDREFRDLILRALGSSRQPPAVDFLLALVRSGSSRDAAAAVEALKLNDSDEIQALIEQARKQRAP